MRITHFLSLLLLGVLFTLANVVKPLHMDDGAYYYHARHLAQRPLDPYGFEMFWYQHPESAMDVLMPPVVSYWWSLAYRVAGERVWAWKLWIGPFGFLFIGSLYFLARRWARGLELPLVWMTVLSPVFLPSMNLMLDIPALSLSLFALNLFLRACDKNALFPAVGAGIVAGLALETKYTSFLTPPTLFLVALLQGRLRLWFVTTLIAGAMFVGWEWWIALKYGESHFLLHAREDYIPLTEKGYLAGVLFLEFGSIGPTLLLACLAVFRASTRVLILAALVWVVSYGFIAWQGEANLMENLPNQGVFRVLKQAFPEFLVNQLIFGPLGFVTACMLLVVIGRSGRVSKKGLLRLAAWMRLVIGSRGRLLVPTSLIELIPRSAYRDHLFLILWLGGELVGYFLLTPFPAVRRLMGVFVAAILLTGHLAARTGRADGQGQRRALIIALITCLLGIGFWVIDMRDALVREEAAHEAASWIEDQRQGGTVWYVGHWGFQYYAEQEGMQPVDPNHSQLAKGDWLVVPGSFQDKQVIDMNQLEADLVWTIHFRDILPWRIVQCFYGGSPAIQQRQGPRFTVDIYRVTREFVPVQP